MKKTRSLLFLAVFTVGLLASCKKDEPAVPVIPENALPSVRLVTEVK